MTAMLIVSIVGVVTFIAGAVFLAIKYFKQQSKLRLLKIIVFFLILEYTY